MGMRNSAPMRFGSLLVISSLIMAPVAAAPPQRAPTAAEATALAGYQKAFQAAFERRDFPAVEAALRGTLAIQQRTVGEENQSTLITLGTLALAVQIQQKLPEAEALFRRELAIRRRVDGEASPATARAAGNVGSSLEQQGRFADAEPFYRSALAFYVAAGGPNSAEAATGHDLLANNLGRQGKNEEALAEANRARALLVAAKGAESVDAAGAYDSVGKLLTNLGRFEEAEAELRHALAIRTREFGENGNLTSGTANNLGIALTQQGKYAEAETMFRRALAVRRQINGAQSPQAADVLSNLASAVQNGGNPTAAEPMLREALAIRMGTTGADHPGTLTAATNLSTCLNELGRYAEAEQFARQAYDGRLRTLGENHPETAIAAGNLAGNLASLGRDGEAELLYRRALAISRATNGEEHPTTAITYSNLAHSLAEQGRYREAEELQRRALAIRRRVLPADHQDTAENLQNLGYVLEQQQNYAAADPLFRESLESLRRRFGDESLAVARATNNLAANLDSLGRPEEAAPLYARSYEIRLKLLGPDHPQTLLSAGNLAYSRNSRGQKAEATRLLRDVVATQRRVYGNDHPARVTALNNLSMILAEQPGAEAEALAAAREAVGIAARRRQAIVAGRAGGADRAAQAQVRARSTETLRNDPLVTSYIALMQVDWTTAGRNAAQLAPLRAEAFVAAQEIEVSKAGQAMARTAARAAAGRGPLGTLVARQQELSDRIAGLDEAYAAAVARGDRITAQQITGAIDTAATQLAAADTEIARRFPDYRTLVAPAALDVAEVQRRLRPGEGLLLIVPSNGDMFSFAVTADRVAWHRVAQRQMPMKREVAALLCQVDPVTCQSDPPAARTPFEQQGYAPFDRATAYALYRDLVAPVESALAGAQTVYVTTTGTLATLPLGLLVTAAPAAGDDADPAVLGRTPWLADRYALVALPAVSTLRALDRPARGDRTAFVGYGAPVLAGEDAGARGRGVRAPRAAIFRATGQGPAMADQALLQSLSPLPGTRRELSAMASALDAPESMLRLAEADTETALKRDPALGRARVIAFATHGLLPQELGSFDEPGLVFTPPAQPSAEDDGVLAASEAAELRLTADWVILSACNTAGAESGAESLSGLARAFLYAGAGSLLASHWRVSDEATAVLTVETLKADATLTRAEAVQTGMRAVRTGRRADGSAIAGWDASWAHPTAWAPFSLIADQNQ